MGKNVRDSYVWKTVLDQATDDIIDYTLNPLMPFTVRDLRWITIDAVEEYA